MGLYSLSVYALRFSLVHCFFTVPVFSKPFICQLLVEVQLFDALCCLVGFICSKYSGLVLLLIRHLYLISEFILELFVCCDGALMSKKSYIRTELRNVFSTTAEPRSAVVHVLNWFKPLPILTD